MGAASEGCQYHMDFLAAHLHPAAFRSSLTGLVSPEIQSQEPHNSTVIPRSLTRALMMAINSPAVSLVCFSPSAAAPFFTMS